jgi:hypothetical protein
VSAVDGPGPVPPAGPLEQWPDVTAAQARAMLEAALEGLALGPVDVVVRDRLTDPDRSLATAAVVVAGWLRRVFEAGLSAGRAEVVDEQPTVQRLRAEIERRARIEAGLIAERKAAEDDAEVYGRVVDEVVTAAADAATAAAEDDTADARAALVALLVRIERAAGPLTGRRS